MFITWNIYPISTRLNVAGDAPEPGIKPNCQTTFTERAILSCGCCPIDMSGFYKKSDGSFGVDVFYTKEQAGRQLVEL